MNRLFSYTIEKDEDGYYVAEVHQLPGCQTQSKSLDELQERLKEAIELYLEARSNLTETRFVGVNQLEVEMPIKKDNSFLIFNSKRERILNSNK